MSPILKQACERAWLKLKANPAMLITDASISEGMTKFTLGHWIAKYHPGELQTMRVRAGLYLRTPTPRKQLSKA